jgi:hypothetical protein
MIARKSSCFSAAIANAGMCGGRSNPQPTREADPFGMLGRGDEHRLPAEPVVLAQDGTGTNGVAAVDRQGVVNDVKNAHRGHPFSVSLPLSKKTRHEAGGEK